MAKKMIETTLESSHSPTLKNSKSIDVWIGTAVVPESKELDPKPKKSMLASKRPLSINTDLDALRGNINTASTPPLFNNNKLINKARSSPRTTSG